MHWNNCSTVQNLEDQQKAVDAGADVAGHLNVITAIEKGELKMDNVDYVVCHVDSLADTLKLRGLLKKNMPDRKKGKYPFCCLMFNGNRAANLARGLPGGHLTDGPEWSD